MHPQDLEPELETLLLRLVPNQAQQWEAATKEEMARMEQLAGRPLPRFYRWFLARMGRSMGPTDFRSLDCSVTKILSAYAEGEVKPHRRFLMIGYETDELMPLHLLYDFDHMSRDDARVVRGHALGGPIHNQFDGFREMLSWVKFSTWRVEKLPQFCEGSFSGSPDVAKQLDSVMSRLGFTSPIPSSPCFAVYDRSDAAMSMTATPRDPPSKYYFFGLGGNNQGELRRILGTVATETSLKVEVETWRPPLSA
jgi:hypothetical protein